MSDVADDKDPKGSPRSDGGILADLFKARVGRLNASLNPVALEATVLGPALAFPMVLGYFAGHWLDARFRVEYWTPALLIVGVGLGFREFFHTLKRFTVAVQRSEQAKKAVRHAEATGNVSVSRPKGQALKPDAGVKALGETGQNRSFRVPAPPVASYISGKDVKQEEETVDVRQDDDISTLTERLLKENDNRNLSP